jgi:carbonic anhydrase
MQRLIGGFKRFQQQYFGDDKRLYESMKEGQPAKILMIACCDSRVDPAILTDCNPGDLFIVRNVANLVPPCENGGDYHGTSAALEYAVNDLKVENIIVMGHANCGGIKALWNDDGTTTSQFIQPWVSIAQSAKDEVAVTHAEHDTAAKLVACEQAAILVSLKNLLSFPFIKDRVEKGNLNLYGWYFDMRLGELFSYCPTQNLFVIVE